MRTLEFEVKEQRLRKQPGCDFSYIVAGSSGYLRAKFNFSSEWDGCQKAASFFAENSELEIGVLLDRDDCCMIPHDVLEGGSFSLFVTGVRVSSNVTQPKYLIQSGKMTVRQEVITNG